MDTEARQADETIPPPQKAEARSYRYEGTLTALSSIAHGGETKSTTQILRTEKLVRRNGEVVQIPIYSGNALRGILRDAGMRFMLRCLGDPPLSTGAVHFLFSGGALTTAAQKGERPAAPAGRRLGSTAGTPVHSTIVIGDARQLMDAIPLVGVFGGACGSMIMEGKLRVGKAVPICAEAAGIIPERYHLPEMPSVWEYLQTESYTRRDDTKRESIRGLIAEDERKRLDGAQARARQAAVAEEPDAVQHTQMRYHVQTYAAGTPFYWWLALHDATLLEWEALASCLVEFSKSPAIGGKAAAGLGQVRIALDNWMEILPSAVPSTALGNPLGKLYSAHLDAQKETILGLLAAV